MLSQAFRVAGVILPGNLLIPRDTRAARLAIIDFHTALELINFSDSEKITCLK